MWFGDTHLVHRGRTVNSLADDADTESFGQDKHVFAYQSPRTIDEDRVGVSNWQRLDE
jgi:hypothetical protein